MSSTAGNSHRPAASQPVAGGAQTYSLWGRVPVLIGSRIDIGLVRISESGADDKAGHILRSTVRTHQETDAARVLAELPDEVLSPGPMGEIARFGCGLVELYFDDLDDRAPHTLLGYVGVVEGVLVLLVMSSGIELNLPPALGSRVQRARNAFTEALLEAIEVLEPANLVAARFNRTVRELGQGGQIISALRDAGTLLWDEDGCSDFSSAGDLTLAGLKASLSDGDGQGKKSDMFGGRIDAIEGGGRDFAWTSLPPGYGPEWKEVNGVLVPVKKTVVARPELQAAIKEMWSMFADGSSRLEIGLKLKELKWPRRGTASGTAAEVENHRVLRDLADRMVTPRNLELHSTGCYRTVRRTASKVRKPGGAEVRRSISGRTREADVVGTWPLPMFDGLPWGLGPELIAEARARFDREEAARLSGEPVPVIPPGRGYPLVECGTWTDGDRLATFRHDHTTMQLRSQPRIGESAAFDGQAGRSDLIASCNDVLAVNALGWALLAALTNVASRTQALVVDASESELVRSLKSDLKRSREYQSELKAQASAADQLAVLAITSDDSVDAERHRARASELRRQDEVLTRKDEDLVRKIAEARAVGLDERADLSHPLGVAVAMTKFDGSDGSMGLRRPVRSLGMAQTLRGRFDEARGVIACTATATIRLLDGTTTEMPLPFDWPNTSNARNTEVPPAALADAWVSGATISELAKRWGRRPKWIWNVLAEFYSSVGVDQTTALLDCPLLSIRRAVHSALVEHGGSLPSDLTERFIVEQMVRPGAAKGFVAYDHRNDRRLLRALVLAGGEADVATLRAAGVADLTVQASSMYVSHRPPITRSERTGIRRLISCPHCDGFASHLIYTAVTFAHPVACPDCHRLPDRSLREVVLPDDFFEFWDRVEGAGATPSHARGTALRKAEDYEPSAPRLLGSDLIRMRDVRRILGLSISGMQGVRSSGKLPAPVVSAPIALWERSEIVALAEEWTALRPRRIKDGLLSPAQAAEVIGVNEHSVRLYCKKKMLRHTMLSDRYRIKPAVAASFTPPAGDLLTSMSLKEAARRAGVAYRVVVAAASEGELATVLCRSGRPHVTEAEFCRWHRARAAE